MRYWQYSCHFLADKLAYRFFGGIFVLFLTLAGVAT
ncbi:hypothetical protein yaldo0001_38980, partial [Yersinia aldovae ATCC 35236]